VLQTLQPGEARGLAIVVREQKAEALTDALIDQNLHEARAIRSFRASSKASRARACGTVGNPSRKSSRLSPPSRYSNRVWTGTRVPGKDGHAVHGFRIDSDGVGHDLIVGQLPTLGLARSCGYRNDQEE